MWLENTIMAQYLAQKYITNAKYKVHERNINTENKNNKFSRESKHSTKHSLMCFLSYCFKVDRCLGREFYPRYVLFTGETELQYI
jgi:hypothetical protein